MMKLWNKKKTNLSGRPLVRRKRFQGFTLLEILLAMAILALGGVSILALFLANADRSRQAADASRSVNIAASVRSILKASLQAPAIVQGTFDVNEPGKNQLYAFSFPFATLNDPRSREDSGKTTAVRREEGDLTPYFFRLPSKPYQGDASPPEAYTVLPRQLLDIQGNPIGSNASVWYYKPTDLTRAGIENVGDAVDLDDNESYAFSFFIRRSVARNDVDPFADDTIPKLIDGLYVVQLRIFKGYDPSIDTNRPIQEFSFTLAAGN